MDSTYIYRSKASCPIGSNPYPLSNVRDISVCKKLLKEDFSIEASEEDCKTVRRICEAVSTRAARLAAVGIVTLAKKIDKIDSCTVAVDGSLYKKHPYFSHRCVCFVIFYL